MAVFPSTIKTWQEVPAPPTSARVYFSYSIGITPNSRDPFQWIGTLQNFQVRGSRRVEPNRGIANNGGIPFELVPGPADLTINVQYVALYAQSLVQAFGYSFGPALEQNLMHMSFDILEQCIYPTRASLYKAGGTPTDKTVQGNTFENTMYYDCLFQELGRTVTTGQVFIVETGTIRSRYSSSINPVVTGDAPVTGFETVSL